MIKKILIAVIIFFVLVGVIIGVASCEPTPNSPSPTEEPQQKENVSGLSEATRMEVFREISLCEQVADRTAMSYYYPGCENCPEFIEADLDKYMDMSADSLANCKETITSQYNITEDTYWDIAIEGIENNWPTDYQGIPDCCGPQSGGVTQSSQLTIEEQDYISSVVEIGASLSGALIEAGGLLENYQVGNDEWTLQVAAQIVVIRAEYEEAVMLMPPDSLIAMHNKFELGMVYLNDFTYLLVEGIDNVDAKLIEDAGIKLEEGAGLVVEAIGLMNDYSVAQ